MALVGSHVNTTFGFVTTVAYAKKTGCEIYQMFLGSPRSTKPHKRKNIIDLKEIRIFAEKFKIKILIHAAYVLNYCNPIDSSIHTDAVQSLANNLMDADILGAIGVVVHMGKNVTRNKLSEEQALNNYVSGIRSVLEKTKDIKQKILFETGASVGTEICSSIEGLKKLYDQFTDEEKKRLGFCVDTCHIFASGYDIRTVKGVNDFYQKFNKLIGWKNVDVVHFNDSLGKCDSHVDRHGDIGRGEIGLKGLKLFAKLCWKTKLPMVLETKCFYYDNENCIEKDEKKWNQCKRFTHQDQMVMMKKWIEKWNST